MVVYVYQYVYVDETPSLIFHYYLPKYGTVVSGQFVWDELLLKSIREMQSKTKFGWKPKDYCKSKFT